STTCDALSKTSSQSPRCANRQSESESTNLFKLQLVNLPTRSSCLKSWTKKRTHLRTKFRVQLKRQSKKIWKRSKSIRKSSRSILRIQEQSFEVSTLNS